MNSPSSSSPVSSAAGPLQVYKGLQESGAIVAEEAQLPALRALEVLWRSLTAPKSLFGFFKKSAAKGIYLWGGVGRGKTMLMDMFYESLPTSVPKARWHFHAFMLRVHDDLHQTQKSGGAQALDDVLLDIADRYSNDVKVLCFDELVVKDVADAMLVSRLFGRMIDNDVALVFTSNTAPQDLYKGGWQRERFLPFIGLIQSKMDVVEVNGAHDFRTRHLSAEDLYLDSTAPQTPQRLEQDFKALTGGQEGSHLAMLVKGHALDVPRTAGRVAWFSFADLCEKPLASVDYLALCERFDSFIIDHLPVLDDTKRNEAKRFIALIDSLYDTKRRLIVAAEAEPNALYTGADHAGEFIRTASRLEEMRSQAYWDAQG